MFNLIGYPFEDTTVKVVQQECIIVQKCRNNKAKNGKRHVLLLKMNHCNKGKQSNYHQEHVEMNQTFLTSTLEL
jgi:hypothetical protein